jgi:hypothetical protein
LGHHTEQRLRQVQLHQRLQDMTLPVPSPAASKTPGRCHNRTTTARHNAVRSSSAPESQSRSVTDRPTPGAINSRANCRDPHSTPRTPRRRTAKRRGRRTGVRHEPALGRAEQCGHPICSWQSPTMTC